MTNKIKNNKPDTTKEALTPERFNKNMALMLSWGYLLCAIVSFFLGNWMLSYTNDIYHPDNLMGAHGLMGAAWAPFALTFDSVFFLPLIVCIICYMAMYFTASRKIQMVIFHLSALNLSPVLAVIYMYITTFTHVGSDWKNTSISGMHLAVFWLMIAAYVLLVFLLSKVWNALFSKARYIIAAASAYTAVMTLLAGMLTGLWGAAFTGLFLFTMLIGLNWFHSYQKAQRGNAFYAVTESCRIMNLFGTAFDMKGKTIPSLVQR